MPKKQDHEFIKLRGVAGVSVCKRCDIKMYKIKGLPTILARNGVIDNSDTKYNCFKLSKK